LAAVWASHAAAPTFYLLEPFPPGGFLVHFDTEENRRYELQASSEPPEGAAGAKAWKTVYVAEPFPFANHYIVLDPETNSPVRFYRLIAEP
jgi:hypothetical protein